MIKGIKTEATFACFGTFVKCVYCLSEHMCYHIKKKNGRNEIVSIVVQQQRYAASCLREGGIKCTTLERGQLPLNAASHITLVSGPLHGTTGSGATQHSLPVDVVFSLSPFKVSRAVRLIGEKHPRTAVIMTTPCQATNRRDCRLPKNPCHNNALVKQATPHFSRALLNSYRLQLYTVQPAQKKRK